MPFELACILTISITVIAIVAAIIANELIKIRICMEEIAKIRVIMEVMLERSAKNGH